MAKQLTITITPDAQVSVETSGFSGEECIAATKQIEGAIGTVTDRRKKPEAFRPGITPTQGVGGA